MKRSEINTYLAEALAAFQKAGFTLPPFGYLPYAKWSTRGHEYDEIRRCMLGWDITDFGSGDFLRIGLTLFTLRNGDPTDPAGKTAKTDYVTLQRDRSRRCTTTPGKWRTSSSVPEPI